MEQIKKNVTAKSNKDRNNFVRQQITDAALQLLAEKPLNDISISELCKKAAVGRTSFYRNYENRESIISSYIKQIFHEWIDELKKSTEMPLSGQIKTLFTHFEAHRDFYELLNDRGLLWLLKNVVIDILGPKPDHSQAEAYSRAYVAYMLYGWIDVWFQRGMKESAEEIAALFKAQGL